MLSFTAPTLADAFGAAVLGACFVVVFVVAEVLWRVFHVKSELTRKLVHTGGGLTVLLVPHVLTSTWVALALAAVFAGILLGAKKLKLLPSVHSIERRSVGAALFPLAVALIAVLSGGRPLLFEVPLLALALGDAAAAVVGQRFGKSVFFVGGHQRSLEGSAAFCAVTFVCAFIAFVVAGRDVAAASAVAVVVAVVLAAVEAGCGGGWDNLAIPMAGVVLVDVVKDAAPAVVVVAAAACVWFAAFATAAIRRPVLVSGGVP